MRDCTELDLFGHSIFIAGGISSGDSPSDTMDSIHRLEEHDILDKCGFNSDIGLDYAGILSSILENKEALPLLMGKHTQLDKLINKIFRKE